MTLTADDRLDIIEAVYRWAHAADSDDPGPLGDLVTDDATFEIHLPDAAARSFSGRDAIVDAYRADVANRGVQTRRHVRNTVFVETSRDRVTTRSYFLLTGVADVGLAKPLATGVYEDELVRSPDGWRIRRRVALPDGSPDLDTLVG